MRYSSSPGTLLRLHYWALLAQLLQAVGDLQLSLGGLGQALHQRRLSFFEFSRLQVYFVGLFVPRLDPPHIAIIRPFHSFLILAKGFVFMRLLDESDLQIGFLLGHQLLLPRLRDQRLDLLLFLVDLVPLNLVSSEPLVLIAIDHHLALAAF